jgi:hypothetical protein
VSDDLLTKFDRAAAQPGREVPFSVIERRLHVRRSRRRGGIALSACAIVAGVITTFAFTGSNGPSVETVHPASSGRELTFGDPPMTVVLPDGWSESPLPVVRTEPEVLIVGTVSVPANTFEQECPTNRELRDDVFVRIFEYTHLVILSDEPPVNENLGAAFGPRPPDFANAVWDEGTCFDPETGPNGPRWPALSVRFRDSGRYLQANLLFGSSATAEQHAQAFALLNSLRVEPFEVLPPPTTTPPSTVPPSAETRAVEAAFDTWLDTQPRDDPAVGAVIEDFEAIKASIQEAAAKAPLPLEGYEGGVIAVTRITDTEAEVIYEITNDGASVLTAQGRAVKIKGVWKVSRDTVCAALEVGGTQCPPRDS